MQVRSSRAETLTLVRADGKPPIALFEETREAGELATQDVFQVSPDGAYLAYASDGVLHVRAVDGGERTIGDYERFAHMRFSPDGKYLAAIVGDSSNERGRRVVVLDLAAGGTRELGAFSAVTQLEWMRGAVVAQIWDSARSKQALVELPLTGASTTLLERASDSIDRFVAAPTGTRIVAFVRENTKTHIISFDATKPSETVEIGVIDDLVTNAASSADGEHIAFTTAAAVFTTTGNARPQAISDRSAVHSLWFARDGRLGYASSTSATILDSDHARRFDTDGPISMLRFDPVSGRALVATPKHAWDVAPAHPQLLATADPGAAIVGVDEFAGGLLLWTQD